MFANYLSENWVCMKHFFPYFNCANEKKKMHKILNPLWKCWKCLSRVVIFHTESSFSTHQFPDFYSLAVFLLCNYSNTNEWELIMRHFSFEKWLAVSAEIFHSHSIVNSLCRIFVRFSSFAIFRCWKDAS